MVAEEGTNVCPRSEKNPMNVERTVAAVHVCSAILLVVAEDVKVDDEEEDEREEEDEVEKAEMAVVNDQGKGGSLYADERDSNDLCAKEKG
eukprot:m.92289 g.92289  ORF g.92289 m.92289 type:complete len:91 (+) comp14660_c3_seq1:3043-3315(+)